MARSRAVVALSAAVVASLAGIASAVPVLITAPTTISATGGTITPTAGGAPVALANAEITVRGTTLTINGRHTVQSLTIERAGTAPGIAGVVTHDVATSYDYSGVGTDIVNGLALTVTGAVSIQGASGSDVASRIDLDGRGFASGTGPGTAPPSNVNGWSAGGGHGGYGGRGFAQPSTTFGGTAYGSLLEPSTFGSGGGANSPSGTGLTGAGAGGGALKLTVQGALVVDGQIRASGTNGTPSWWSSGGGAGGSIWITAPSLSGVGTISANGGAGDGVYGAGGGGGGRIAMNVPSTASFSGTITAFGGSGALPGGPGTIATIAGGSTFVLVANNQATDAGALVNITSNIAGLEVRDHGVALVGGAGNYGAVTVRNVSILRVSTPAIAASIDVQAGGRIDTALPLSPINLTCTTFNLASGATVSVDAMGYAPGAGPGAGGLSVNDGGGAGHGGFGGRGYIGAPSDFGTAGAAYGSFSAPVDAGSGGGASSSSGTRTEGAGSGGGIVRIVATNATINGTVTANGTNGGTPWYDAGGGSGGSVWFTAGTLTGNGVIRANGGDGGRSYSTGGAGGGSGGRIALVVTSSSSFSGMLEAKGGRGTLSGAAGTIYTKTGANQAGLSASTVNANPAITPFPSVMGVEFSVGSGARATFAPGSALSKLNVLAGGHIVTEPMVAIDFSVASDMAIEIGGTIDGAGMGYPANQGPSGGSTTFGAGAGGGHGGGGGAGGQQPSFATPSFGAVDAPFGFGSGGGSSSSSGNAQYGGGAGGGAIRLEVGGTLNLQGVINADGLNGVTTWYDSGGGAGGGVHVAAASIVGSGTISARGGNGGASYNPGGGGGGGGRIGIFSCNTSLPLGNILVNGGEGGGSAGHDGGVGSIFFGASTVHVTDHPDPVNITVGQPWTMSVVATTSQPNGQLTYQWRRRNDSGEYVPIEEGFDNRFYNVNTPQLYVSSGRCVQEAYYDCIVTDSCGSFPSRAAFAQIVEPLPCPCPADFDQSGGIDGSDLMAFFLMWEAGEMVADLDESGGIDYGDVTSFFASYEGGC